MVCPLHTPDLAVLALRLPEIQASQADRQLSLVSARRPSIIRCGSNGEGNDGWVPKYMVHGHQQQGAMAGL